MQRKLRICYESNMLPRLYVVSGTNTPCLIPNSVSDLVFRLRISSLRVLRISTYALLVSLGGDTG